MNVLYGLGEAGAVEVAKRVSQKGGHDSVRVTLRILEKKGHVVHRQDGRRYVYSPTVPHKKASRSAVRGLVSTFFRGSPTLEGRIGRDSRVGRGSEKIT
jgi:predicted transcriptional regulator